MTPDQFKRVKALYLELESVAPEQQLDRLEEACADDPVVRDYVANMLKQAATDDDTLLSKVSGQIQRILNTGDRRLEDIVGERIGAYDIEDILGHGGMGIVYRAKDWRLDRWAALKAVLPNTDDRENYLHRFRREARVLASLSHPNIATVFGLEEAHGTLFLAMELIEGKTLAQRLGRGAMPIEAALETCQQVAAGVEAAHEAGIIHRDLKPANIMFTRDDTVKVLDFGLARETADASQRDSLPLSLTRKGSLFGTPAYMSPEQARGEPLDERSDVFSFGAVLYKCLTGRGPFGGETNAEVMECVLTREPDLTLLPANLPASVRSILTRCLAKRPAERYRHIGDVRLDLLDALKARDWDPRTPKLTPRRRLLRALPWAAAILMAATAGTVLMLSGAVAPIADRIPSQRFDLTLPEDATQRDLERLQLALSPDGQTIAVACQTPTGQAIWTRSHNDGIWRKIDGTHDGHRPAFTRDGQWILFYRNNYVFKQRVTGRGEPTRLAATTNWYGTAALDDGRIVYSPAWGAPLSVVSNDLKEQTVTKVATEKGEVSHIGPTAVANSPWLLYNVWLGGEECNVYATNVQTAECKRVVSNGSCGRVARTPRGDYLLFERSSIIFAAPFDRATAMITGAETAIAEGVLNDGTRFSSYFDAGDDGTLVYFPGSAFAEESRLAYVSDEGTSVPVHDDRLSFSEPSFSTDGSIVVVGIKGKIYRTMLYNLTQKTREYVVTGGDTLSQAISPDAKTIALTVNRDGGYGIDLHSRIDGRRIKRLVEPGADYPSDLTFSPDGKHIAFAMSPAAGKPRDVWVADATEPSAPRGSVSTTGGDTLPAFSPDGKWLAYSSDISGRSEVYVISFPSADVTRQITSRGGESPAWSPDGKKIYYIASGKLMSLDLTADALVTGQPTDVYTQPFGQSDPLGKNFTIAPDGRPVVVEPSERRPSITHMHVITHWYDLLPK